VVCRLRYHRIEETTQSVMKVLWNWMVAGLLVSVSVSRCEATALSAVISGVARRYV
jgi:FtsH-binding integral membrane protein